MAQDTGVKGNPGTAFWQGFPIFEDIADSTLARLGTLTRRREWPAGTVMFQRGDAGDYLVAIASGRVKLSLATASGRELVLAIAESGTIIGEMALFDDEPRSADATTLLPTVGYVLSRRDFLSLVENDPDLQGAMIRFLCRRLRDTNDKLESIVLYSLDARVARFLLFTLRQIHGQDLPAEAMLRLTITQTELAAVLGASRPKVNRALQLLLEDQVIRRDGDVLTCNVERLTQLAEPDGD
jgi:CRP-like cAMP-binding protein